MKLLQGMELVSLLLLVIQTIVGAHCAFARRRAEVQLLPVSRALSDPLEALFRATPRVSVQKSYEEQVQVKHFCFACCQA